MREPTKLSPVKKYPAPRYPLQDAVRQDPSLLQALPQRWQMKPAVCAALAFTLASGLWACGTDNAPSAASQVSGPASSAVRPAQTPAPACQVPVFQHGDGRGSYGCVSVAPPVFLSEAEAAQVIREEAEKLGLDFSGTKTLTGDFPATDMFHFTDEPVTATRNGELALDGYSESLDLGFEFVSSEDIAAWQKDTDNYVSVESYDFLGTAQRLSESAPNLAVFYDPGYSAENAFEPPADGSEDEYRASVEAYEQAERQRKTEALREQVKDFLAWLQGQGVI